MAKPSELTEGQFITITFPDVNLLFIYEYSTLWFVVCPPGSGGGTDKSAEKQIPAEVTAEQADHLFINFIQHPNARVLPVLTPSPLP